MPSSSRDEGIYYYVTACWEPRKKILNIISHNWSLKLNVFLTIWKIRMPYGKISNWKPIVKNVKLYYTLKNGTFPRQIIVVLDKFSIINI